MTNRAVIYKVGNDGGGLDYVGFVYSGDNPAPVRGLNTNSELNLLEQLVDIPLDKISTLPAVAYDVKSDRIKYPFHHGEFSQFIAAYKERTVKE